jgi:hypothetical protein
MNRLTRYALTLLAVVGLASVAHAQASQVLRTVPVVWHTTLDPSTFPNSAVAYSAGDSALRQRGAGVSTATSQPIDTTAAINIRQFVLPGPYQNSTAADTTGWLRFNINPVAYTGSPTVTADTVLVLMQVSDDKANWSTAEYTGPLPQDGAAIPTKATVLETGSSNSFQFIVRQATGAIGPFATTTSNSTTLKQIMCFGYKWARFIVTGDHQGAYSAEITGYIPANREPFTSPN